MNIRIINSGIFSSSEIQSIKNQIFTDGDVA